jgi:hypothetical protein
VVFHRGTRVPGSIEELLDGLPQGTKRRHILRASAATDPLTEDGEWRIIGPEPKVIAKFAKRVQEFNNGSLPANASRFFDRFTVVLANTPEFSTGDAEGDDPRRPDEDDEDGSPMIGVASRSKARSVLTYYGAENHSKWIFSPLFRGAGLASIRTRAPQNTNTISR